MKDQKIIPGVLAKYEAHRSGYIINTDTGRIMKASPVRGFYVVRVLNLDADPFMLRVSRGVLLAFKPIEEAGHFTVKHKDDDLSNARLENLDWAYRFGENHGRSKITEGDVREIRNLYSATGLSLRAIGEKFGVAYKTVQGIISGDIWTHVL